MGKYIRHNRQSIRIPEYDYAQPGAYFVTICTHQKAHLFGRVEAGVMRLNRLGEIVDEEWQRTFGLRDNVEIDEYVVMPNHFHGIVVVCGRGTARRAPTTWERFGQPVCGSIPTIVRAFKSAATKRINECRRTPGNRVWQRNYHEHVIRHDRELERVREYIQANPARWR